MTLRSGVDLVLDKVLNERVEGTPETNQFTLPRKPIPAVRRALLQRVRPQTSPLDIQQTQPTVPPVKTPLLQRRTLQIPHPQVKLPSGGQMDYPMTEQEWDNMPVNERKRYLTNPQEWLKEKPVWEKVRKAGAQAGVVLETLLGIEIPEGKVSKEEVEKLASQSYANLAIASGLNALGPIAKAAGIEVKSVIPQLGKVEQVLKTPLKVPEGSIESQAGFTKLPGKKPAPQKGTIVPKEGIPQSEDEVLNAFGKKLSSPKTTEEFAQQQEVWATERVSRATRFNELLQQEIAKGTSAEESIQRATNALKGEYSRVSTGLDLPPEVKDAAYAKIIKVIQADDTIPEATKAFEISATRTALDNALMGKPIPNIAGRKGGSAKTRLLKVFSDNPVMQDIIKNPEVVQKRLLAQSLPPEELDQNLLDYLRGLQPKGSQLDLIKPEARVTLAKKLSKIGVNIVDALGIPKALKFSFDVSMPFRQGLIPGVRHPVSWVKGWKPMMQALKSEEVALKLNREMLTDPEIMEAISKEALDLYGVEKGLGYLQRPETMASKIAEKFIPGVRPSARAAAVFMNKVMTDIGTKNLRIMKKMGASEEEYKAMGALINQLAGRGTIPKGKSWESLFDVANKLLTSPRYVASRFQFPTKVLSSSKAVRQEAASTLVAWSGLMTTILGVAYASGARVELDPRSSDAYKIRIGDKRIDIWVGYAQIIRALAQLATGQRKTAEGKIVPITPGQVLGRYAQSKESPGIGALVMLLSGENYIGEKIDLKTLEGIGKFAKETFFPAALEEMIDAYVIEGSQSAALSGIGMLGVGVSTYEGTKPKPVVPIPPSEKPRISSKKKMILKKK